MLFKSYLAERRARKAGIKEPIPVGPPKSAPPWPSRPKQRFRRSVPDWGGSVI